MDRRRYHFLLFRPRVRFDPGPAAGPHFERELRLRFSDARQRRQVHDRPFQHPPHRVGGRRHREIRNVHRWSHVDSGGGGIVHTRVHAHHNVGLLRQPRHRLRRQQQRDLGQSGSHPLRLQDLGSDLLDRLRDRSVRHPARHRVPRQNDPPRLDHHRTRPVRLLPHRRPPRRLHGLRGGDRDHRLRRHRLRPPLRDRRARELRPRGEGRLPALLRRDRQRGRLRGGPDRGRAPRLQAGSQSAQSVDPGVHRPRHGPVPRRGGGVPVYERAVRRWGDGTCLSRLVGHVQRSLADPPGRGEGRDVDRPAAQHRRTSRARGGQEKRHRRPLSPGMGQEKLRLVAGFPRHGRVLSRRRVAARDLVDMDGSRPHGHQQLLRRSHRPPAGYLLDQVLLWQLRYRGGHRRGGRGVRHGPFHEPRHRESAVSHNHRPPLLRMFQVCGADVPVQILQVRLLRSGGFLHARDRREKEHRRLQRRIQQGYFAHVGGDVVSI
mmetsp:Transcript_6584/g.14215  ORF Transcript_6584/g.14215 Transcript_6584/m.14215 type:complete len:490 (-) Transcript_6584:344-1813(-)